VTTRSTLAMRVTSELRNELAWRAESAGISVSELARQIIHDALDMPAHVDGRTVRYLDTDERNRS